MVAVRLLALSRSFPSFQRRGTCNRLQRGCSAMRVGKRVRRCPSSVIGEEVVFLFCLDWSVYFVGSICDFCGCTVSVGDYTRFGRASSLWRNTVTELKCTVEKHPHCGETTSLWRKTNKTKLETITKRLQLLGRHIAHVVLLGTARRRHLLDQLVVLHFAPRRITHFQFLHNQLQRLLAAHKHFIQTKLVQRREGEAFLHASSLARNQQQHLQVVRCQR